MKPVKPVKPLTKDEILELVQDVIREELRLESPVAATTNLVRDLELDSIKQLTLLVELENRFQVKLDAGDEEEIDSLEDVVQLVHRRLSEKS